MRGSERLKRLSESQTLALTKKVRELKAEGKDVLGLTLGEPDFDTPEHIKQAAIDAINGNFTHYPPVAGIPDLREAAANKFRSQNNLPYDPENIVVSTGAKQSLVNVLMSIVNPDEEVILFAPYWVSYLEMVKMSDGKPVVIRTEMENEFKVTPQQLEEKITPNTKAMIFNSPSNPTGTTYTREELAGIVSVLKRNPHVIVITDEIYEHITYDVQHESLGSFPEIFDRVVTINGLSKGFAMTGWRLGYIGAPLWIAKLCEKYQGQITSGASSITQKAAVAALNGPLDEPRRMRDEFRERRDFVFEKLKEIPGVKTFLPEGAFYFYPDLSAYFGLKNASGKSINNIEDLTWHLIEDGNIAVIPGDAFGTYAHVRISYAYSMDSLEKAMRRMKESLGRLQ